MNDVTPHRARIVTETIPLADCIAGDRVRVPYSAGASWKQIGSVFLVKIKRISGNRVQLKYRQYARADAKVLKVDLPGDLRVERSRQTTEEDGPDAGVPEVRTIAHRGIDYRSIDPDADLGPLMEAAILAAPLTTHRSQGSGWSEIMRTVMQHGSEPNHPRSGFLDALGILADGTPSDKNDRRDPDMQRTDSWLGALQEAGVLREGARERLMASVWTEEQLRDGRRHEDATVIDD